MPSTAVGANMRQLHECSHVVTAAVVGHERLLRGLEPLQLVKSEEVVHYYSCQFRPEKTDRLNKTQRRKFHVQSPASILKKIYILSLYIRINVCRLFLQNGLHKFSMSEKRQLSFKFGARLNREL